MPSSHRPALQAMVMAFHAMPSSPRPPKFDDSHISFDSPGEANSQSNWNSGRLTLSEADENDAELAAEIERLLGNDPGEDIDGSDAENDELATEFEADLIRLRTREGMAIARTKGKLRGKTPKLSEKQQKELRRMHDSGDYSISDLAELFSVSRPTVYRTLSRQPT